MTTQPDIQCSSVIAVAQDGGEPIVGITFMCDLDATQEYGVCDLATAIRRAADDNSIPALFRTEPRSVATQADLVTDHGWAVSVSTTAGGRHPQSRHLPRAQEQINNHEPYAKGIVDGWRLSLKPMSELRENARELGIKPLPRLKSELIERIVAATPAQKPEQHAAWFEYGDLLVIQKADGAHRLVVEHLLQASKAGHLTTGKLGVGAFGSGISLFDSRDFSQETVDQLVEAQQIYDKNMKALEPVVDTLRARGHHWHFLGNPQAHTRADGARVVRYWLNGSTTTTPSGRRGQPFGWYTLADLLDEKWIHDLDGRLTNPR